MSRFLAIILTLVAILIMPSNKAKASGESSNNDLLNHKLAIEENLASAIQSRTFYAENCQKAAADWREASAAAKGLGEAMTIPDRFQNEGAIKMVRALRVEAIAAMAEARRAGGLASDEIVANEQRIFQLEFELWESQKLLGESSPRPTRTKRRTETLITGESLPGEFQGCAQEGAINFAR